jgi:hypothetical protein
MDDRIDPLELVGLGPDTKFKKKNKSKLDLHKFIPSSNSCKF